MGPRLVYRPDIIYLRADKAARCTDAVTEIPDLVVEIVSPHSRSYDGVTKRGDYEKAGVGEYLLIDAERRMFTAFVNREGRFVEQPVTGDTYRATQPPGFELDLARLRRLF